MLCRRSGCLARPSGALLLLALLLGLGGSAALFADDSAVPIVDEKDFGAVVRQSPVPVLVKFFVDIDGHCRELAEPYAEAAAELQGVVPFLSVRCRHVDDPPFCAQFNIKRFPTIHMYKPGEGKPQHLHIPTAHEHRLSARQLRDAALGLLTEEHVKHFCSPSDALSWLEAPGTKVVLVWPQASVTPWLKSLSQRFHRDLRFAQVKRTPDSEALLDHYGITQVPALAALTAGHRKVEYTGPLEPLKVQEWLLELIAADRSSSGGEAEDSQGAAEGEL